jgi:hypothetical protein
MYGVMWLLYGFGSDAGDTVVFVSSVVVVVVVFSCGSGVDLRYRPTAISILATHASPSFPRPPPVKLKVAGAMMISGMALPHALIAAAKSP